MLTRPGAGPGCAWMRRISETTPHAGQEPAAQRRWFAWFWGLWIFVMVLGFGIQRAVPGGGRQPYESPMRIAGLPLVATGEAPRAIIAIGGRPIGVVAFGGLSVGVIAVGGLGLGVVCFGGLAAGLLVLGGGALGWWAVGGGAVGYYAFGGLAVGGYAYAGNGVALGYYEAHGRQREKLLGEPPFGR